MDKLTFGRYSDTDSGYSGWIEGTRADGTSWILFLDENGSPAEYYAQRDQSGAVLSEPVSLQ